MWRVFVTLKRMGGNIVFQIVKMVILFSNRTAIMKCFSRKNIIVTFGISNQYGGVTVTEYQSAKMFYEQGYQARLRNTTYVDWLVEQHHKGIFYEIVGLMLSVNGWLDAHYDLAAEMS